jgi:hypothetical protein
METGTQETRTGSRTDRRLSRLIAHYEGLLKSPNDSVSLRAAEKLGDILMRQAELRDKADERQLKRDLAGLRTAPATALVPSFTTPQTRDELIRQLQREVDAKAQRKQALATNDDSEKSFFD